MKNFLKRTEGQIFKNLAFVGIIAILSCIAIFRPEAGESHKSIEFLMDLFIILLSTKVLSLFTKKIQIPAVVGALLAGLFFGPAVLNKLHTTEFISSLSELGVIIIMFTAGLETDIKQLKSCGKASFLVALLGVLTPLALGTILMSIFNNSGSIFNMTHNQFLKNLFMGVILTATSVSITVEVLKELGKLSTKVGSTILGAALIDDVMGIIALTIVTSMADPSVSIMIVLIKIVIFFVLAFFVGKVINKAYIKWMKESEKGLQRHVILSFCLCLGMAYGAEAIFGVADITGAFLAGLILSNVSKEGYIDKRFNTLLYMLLSPVFFASIGIKVQLEAISVSVIIFTICLIAVAFLAKIVGCFIAAKIVKFNKKESLQIGIGMMARGEVALIIANKGAALGLMDAQYFTPLILMVICAAIFTPIVLKIAFKEKVHC